MLKFVYCIAGLNVLALHITYFRLVDLLDEGVFYFYKLERTICNTKIIRSRYESSFAIYLITLIVKI